MTKTHDDPKTLHDCSACSGTGIGTADGIPCWRCKGKGYVDNRETDDWEIGWKINPPKEIK